MRVKIYLMKIEEKFVETKYGKICYLEYGKGKKTAVFFHGFWGGIIHGEFFAKKLSSEEWRVLVPCLPGHGKSFNVPNKYNFTDLVSTMGEFTEKTARNGAVLAGHSLGGAVSWEIACKNPNLVKKLILIDPGLKISHELLIFRGTKVLWNNLVLDRKAGGLIYPMGWNRKAMNLLSGADVSNLLGNIPVLLLYGKDDKITPMRDYEDKLKSLKSLKVQVFEGGHHWYRWQEKECLKAVEDFI